MDKNTGATIMSTLLIIAVFAIYKYIKNFKTAQSRKVVVKVEKEQIAKIKDFSTKAENLKSLRDSNVLSESEYKNKIDKINEEKLDDLVTKTDEYLRLKTLYNDGVFTKEEFESKVKIIRNKIENTDVDEVETLDYTINFIDSSYSLIFGNYKSWKIQFENSSTMNYYTKNSNGKYFIRLNNEVKYFYNKEAFVQYVRKQL